MTEKLPCHFLIFARAKYSKAIVRSHWRCADSRISDIFEVFLRKIKIPIEKELRRVVNLTYIKRYRSVTEQIRVDEYPLDAIDFRVLAELHKFTETNSIYCVVIVINILIERIRNKLRKQHISLLWSILKSCHVCQILSVSKTWIQLYQVIDWHRRFNVSLRTCNVRDCEGEYQTVKLTRVVLEWFSDTREQVICIFSSELIEVNKRAGLVKHLITQTTSENYHIWSVSGRDISE